MGKHAEMKIIIGGDPPLCLSPELAAALRASLQMRGIDPDCSVSESDGRDARHKFRKSCEATRNG